MLDLTMACFRRPPLDLNVKSDLDEGGNTPAAAEGQGRNIKFTKIPKEESWIVALFKGAYKLSYELKL